MLGPSAQLSYLHLVSIGHELRNQRVLWCEHGVGHAEAGVRARGEDLDLDLRPAGMAKRNWAPSDRPIQFRCIVLTRSGQSRPSRASSSSSAYW